MSAKKRIATVPMYLQLNTTKNWANKKNDNKLVRCDKNITKGVCGRGFVPSSTAPWIQSCGKEYSVCLMTYDI